MRIVISFLAPVVLLGTALETRMAAQGVEQALFSMVTEYWSYRKGRRQTVSALLPFSRL